MVSEFSVRHGRQKERHIFGREDLPSGNRQEAVPGHSAVTIETEERLRISREGEHHQDGEREEGLGRQESGGTEA